MTKTRNQLRQERQKAAVEAAKRDGWTPDPSPAERRRYADLEDAQNALWGWRQEVERLEEKLYNAKMQVRAWSDVVQERKAKAI